VWPGGGGGCCGCGGRSGGAHWDYPPLDRAASRTTRQFHAAPASIIIHAALTD